MDTGSVSVCVLYPWCKPDGGGRKARRTGQSGPVMWYLRQPEKTELTSFAFSWGLCLTKVNDAGQVISRLSFCFANSEMRKQDIIFLNHKFIDLLIGQMWPTACFCQ